MNQWQSQNQVCLTANFKPAEYPVMGINSNGQNGGGLAVNLFS